MKIRLVFTRLDSSFISRAIMWFTQRKTHPDRRCAHVLIKFQPEGILGKVEKWASFEAMERGVWLSPYSKSLGKSTVVAEFEMNLPDEASEEVLIESLEKYLDWWYDYAGIGIWATWILFKKWFGSIVNLFNITFRPRSAGKALFCSGLAYKVTALAQEKAKKIGHDANYGMQHLTARTSTPRNEIDICFNYPSGWKYISGLTKIETLEAGGSDV